MLFIIIAIAALLSQGIACLIKITLIWLVVKSLYKIVTAKDNTENR